MEDNCLVVKKITVPRRVGDCITNSLDSVLFLSTYAIMLAIYAYVTATDMGGDLGI
jgi:hypothetical protein